MADKTLQFIQTTPEQLQEAIIRGVKIEINKLQENFQPKQPEELMTRNEVKDFLKVDLSTVHNWTKKGKLKSYGLGHRIYYKRSEVEQAILPLNNQQNDRLR
ncbi:helix-turn-helix domain-containing protein [Maribellus sediminis]|uniref:helix-turn-helix domain-containing protein n=1 Tax=Maribellus sediminis TaxID=2696285 RepID=UPI0014308DB3|nr:helix-turn-helix domain-containing protein [Maribellus sediminis]